MSLVTVAVTFLFGHFVLIIVLILLHLAVYHARAQVQQGLDELPRTRLPPFTILYCCLLLQTITTHFAKELWAHNPNLVKIHFIIFKNNNDPIGYNFVHVIRSWATFSMFYLTVIKWRHMVAYIWVNTGSGNGLLPDCSMPLPEPMLTYHQWSPVTFIWGQFHKRHHLRNQSIELVENHLHVSWISFKSARGQLGWQFLALLYDKASETAWHPDSLLPPYPHLGLSLFSLALQRTDDGGSVQPQRNMKSTELPQSYTKPSICTIYPV